MKKLLLLLILVIASPKIGINVDASNSIASICNIIKKEYAFCLSATLLPMAVGGVAEGK